MTMTETQRVLDAVDTHPGLSLEEATRHAGMGRIATRLLLENLVECGLVEREHDQTTGEHAFTLSQMGEEVLGTRSAAAHPSVE